MFNGLITFNSTAERDGKYLNLIGDTVIGQSTYMPTGFCSMGISASNVTPYTSLTSAIGFVHINSNEIVNVYNGISVALFQWRQAESISNDISLIANALSRGAAQTGISHTRCSNNLIASNYIEGAIRSILTQMMVT